MGNESTDLLRAVRDDVIQCQQCNLSKTRKNPVVGSGCHTADVMFVGDAPGEQEDKQASPLLDTAGKVFDKMLSHINLNRDDVYITNIIKCKPQGDEDPTEDQKNECIPYLIRQIDAIKPKVIVCLGNHAAKTILTMFGHGKSVEGIGKIHGELFEVDPSFEQGNLKIIVAGIKIMPMFNPAAMIHNPPIAEFLRKDFKKLKKVIT